MSSTNLTWSILEYVVPNVLILSRRKFGKTSKRFLENGNWTFTVVRYFTWKPEFFSNNSSLVVFIRIEMSRVNDNFKTRPSQIETRMMWRKLKRLLRTFRDKYVKMKQVMTSIQTFAAILIAMMKFMTK